MIPFPIPSLVHASKTFRPFIQPVPLSIVSMWQTYITLLTCDEPTEQAQF